MVRFEEVANGLTECLVGDSRMTTCCVKSQPLQHQRRNPLPYPAFSEDLRTGATGIDESRHLSDTGTAGLVR